MEAAPGFRKATAGHEDQVFRYARLVLHGADTAIEEFVAGEQTAGRLRDEFANYFDRCVDDVTIRRLPSVSRRVQQEAQEVVKAILSRWLPE